MPAIASRTRMCMRRRGGGASWAALLAAGLIVAATVAAFSNSFAGPFVFDNTASIPENPAIRHLWPLWKPLCPPHGGETVAGRPLLNLSFAINYALGGLDVRGFHAANLAIHLASALLLFGIVRRTLLLPAMRARFATAATPLGLAVAGLWAVHPLQTESVTYIVQRAESLAGCFYLLAIYGLIRGADPRPGGKRQEARGQRCEARAYRLLPIASSATAWYVLTFLACLLGMATKEVTASPPIFALFYDRAFLAGSFREAWRRRRGLYLAMAATWLPLGWLIWGTATSVGIGRGASWWAYFCTQCAAIVHYLRLCTWPHPLVFDYGDRLCQGFWEVAPQALALGVLGAATVLALWRWPKVGLLGLWFFAVLAPTSSFVPTCVTQTMAERRMYLPLAAVVMLVVFGGLAAGGSLVRRNWLPRPWAGILGGLIVAAVVLTLGILTFRRNLDYQSDLSIWRDTVDKAPDNFRGHNNLGLALAGRGQIDEALAHYQTALKIKPDYAEARNNLGAALAGCGRLGEALPHYQRALEIKPDYAEAHNNLGLALAGCGRLDEALAQFQAALAVKPDYAEAHNSLGAALAGCGRLDEAIAHYQTALEIKPDYAEAHNNLGAALARRGRIDGALVHFQMALKIKPDYAEAHSNLGIALAGRGRIDEAIDHYRKALVLAQQQNKAALAAKLRARLRADEAETPHRQP